MGKSKKKKQKTQKLAKKRNLLKPQKKKGSRKRIEIDLKKLQEIVDRSRSGPLAAYDHEILKGAVDTLAFLTSELESKNTSLRRLRRMLFGPTTEKTSQVFGEENKDSQDEEEENQSTSKISASPEKDKPKRKGHGRNGAKDYKGAERVPVPLSGLKRGQDCPKCQSGKLYPMKEPSYFVRVSGMAPLQAKVYELERTRCNLCGHVFTAKTPEGVGYEKYDATAAIMMALLKYGCGLPFNRLERLEGDLGIPLPAATQWEVLNRAVEKLEPVYKELIRQAAQGKVIHNDDTTMKILDLEKRLKDEGARRTGIFTSGILSTRDEQQIAVFLTGNKHAGENLNDILAHRSEELDAPIQMCDGLLSNTSGEFQTILSNCLAHARRKFVDLTVKFPDECKRALEDIKEIYANDDHTQKAEMSDGERLLYHQEHSKSIMDGLRSWIKEQTKQKLVEPNSSLGDAFEYMTNRWEELTLFLRVPGAPLDNNACERVLKKAILHRKNSYFFKTQRGAYVGDLFMSFIHTAELGKVNPFDYLVTLLKNRDKCEKAPAEWMPWNYKENITLEDGTA